MQVNVNIDDALMADVMAATVETSKRGTVQAALRALIRARDPEQFPELLRSVQQEVDRDPAGGRQ